MSTNIAAVPGVPATDWKSIATEVDFAGKKIILPGDPENMSYAAARETLSRIEEQENQKFDVKELVKGAPWDALTAVYKAMQEIYGVVMSKSIQTFFGEIKPELMTIQTGPAEHDNVQVPYGQMQLPGVSMPINIGLHPDGCYIYGTVRRADRQRLIDIRNKAQEILRSHSLYRAKAIKFSVDDDGDMQLAVQPEFIDLRTVTEADMIHTDDTAALIRTNIFSPLKNTAACRQHRIPLKRGILLEGRYGTGKSLTARVTAKVATENGWTFIMLDRSQGLKAAIDFAKQYQPCVIFAEDIDRAADRSDEGVNDLVNTLDGVISKNSEIMVVLTTNFIEKIDMALLRPGRFDAVISIQPPDAKTAVKLIHQYGRELIAEGDLTAVGEVIAGEIPATIREVVERAKLSMLMEGRTQISGEDLLTSAVGMRRHLDLLRPKDAEPSPGDALATALLRVLGGAEVADVDTLSYQVSEISGHVTAARRSLQGIGQKIDGVHKVAAAGATMADKAHDIGRETLAAVKGR